MEHSFDPHVLIKLVRRWAPLVVLMAVLGGGLAYLLALSVRPTYFASGLLRVASPVAIAGQTVLPSSDVSQTAALLMTQDSVLNKVNADLHLGENADQLRGEVSAVPVPNTELITVSASGPNPDRDAAIANGVMTEYAAQVTSDTGRQIDQAGASLAAEIQAVESTLQQENAQLATAQRNGQDTSTLQRQIQADQATLTQLTNNYSSFRAQQALGFDRVTVAAAATVPPTPVNQHKLIDTAIGATAGSLIGLALAVVLQILDQGLRTEEEVRQKLGIPVLGVIPSYALGTGDNAQRRASAAAEAYRRLRTGLLFSGIDHPLHSVVITSSRVGEGKSRTAANLAGVLAAAGTRVLLLDADLRHPSQHRIFNRAMQRGMSELLWTIATKGNPPDVNGVLQTKYPNLSLLTAGTIPPNPAELLASRASENTLRWLEHQYDIVVIDTPPVDVVTDALTLAANASATILVIEAGVSEARQLRHTIERLRELGANVIGAVLNKSRRQPPPGYYEYYEDPATRTPDVAQSWVTENAGVWEPVAEPR